METQNENIYWIFIEYKKKICQNVNMQLMELKEETELSKFIESKNYHSESVSIHIYCFLKI